ncbi:MAG: MoaD/ThiS family protein [Nitrososphaerota archaeon]|nr:MoaD/ThiS family protein [Nitrososphaerota archaeon]
MKEESIPKELQSFGKAINQVATVKIMGSLGQTLEGERLHESITPPQKLGSVLRFLQEKYKLDLRRDSTLIIVNGVEARALEDLETEIVSGDEIVLLPMFHGG